MLEDPPKLLARCHPEPERQPHKRRPRKGEVALAERAIVTRLLGISVQELADLSSVRKKRLMMRLDRALGDELNRLTRGDWAYDRSRHRALARASEAVARMLRTAPPAPQTQTEKISAPGGSQGPCALQAPTAPEHSLAPPSDSRGEAPTSRDILPGKDYSACADGASRT